MCHSHASGRSTIAAIDNLYTPYIFATRVVLECIFIGISIFTIFFMFYIFTFIFVSTCLCFYNTMVYTLAHKLKAFSKPLHKPLLAVSNYEVLLLFYFSVSFLLILS